MINKNKLFRQIHIYVSLFFLPLALIYAITGIAYIFGFNQDVGLKVQEYQLIKSIEVGQEKQALIDFLKENKLVVPADKIIKGKNAPSGSLSIGSTHYSASIIPLSAGEYKITTQTRSLLGDLIMLHKNKGLWYFSVLAVGFGVALLLLYLSGLIITLFAMKKDRDKQLLTLGAGVIITFILAYLSL